MGVDNLLSVAHARAYAYVANLVKSLIKAVPSG